IPENPVLLDKLKTLDSLSMSTPDLVRNYPAPQMVRAMVDGRLPYPADPLRRRMVEKMAERLRARQDAGANQPSPAALRQLLSPDEMRRLRGGTPRDRIAALEALSPDKQDEVLAALPAGVRQALYAAAPPELRRRVELMQAP